MAEHPQGRAVRAQHIFEYVLPFIGAAIGGFVLVVQFRELWGRLKSGDVGPLLLVLVSLLCVAYGVERLTYSQITEERLDSIVALLQKSPKATFNENTSDIWSSIRNIMLDVEHHIRTVQAGDRPNIPAEFGDIRIKLAARLNERKQQSSDVWYRIVLVFDDTKTPEDLVEIKHQIADVLKIYADRGLKDNVELRVFTRRPLTKFDVLIVDTKHVNIGFDTFEGPVKSNVQIQNAMLWENQSALAERLALWFDESVWPNAKPYDIWLKTQQP